MMKTVGNDRVEGSEYARPNVRNFHLYNEDKVEVCFQEIMLVAENTIDLTHVANELERQRFPFAFYQIEILDTICQVLSALGMMHEDRSQETYIWAIPRKTRLAALDDAHNTETDFYRFVNDTLVHKLQVLESALKGLSTDETKSYWCTSKSSSSNEKRSRFPLADRVALFVVYEAYRDTRIVFHDYEVLLRQICLTFERSPGFYKGWEKELLPLTIEVLSCIYVLKVHDGESKNVNGMPAKKKPQFIECLRKISTKNIIRKHKSDVYSTSGGINVHGSSSSSGSSSSGSSSSGSSSSGSRKSSSHGSNSRKSTGSNSTDRVFISTPATTFETSAKKSHSLSKVKKNSNVNKSKGISASTFMENLVKKNPEIAGHALFRGLKSAKQSNLEAEAEGATSDSSGNGKGKAKEKLNVEFTPMEFDRTTMELVEKNGAQNEKKNHLNSGTDDMNMIEFIGEMRYYPFNLQDNRIFLKTSELLGARSLLLVKNIERNILPNDNPLQNQNEISVDDSIANNRISNSAFSHFKKSDTTLSKKRKRGIPWVVDRINVDSWKKMNARDDSVLISKCTD